MSHRSRANGAPILCYVTDRRALSRNDESRGHEALLQKVAENVAAGVDWIQIREKDLFGKECAALTGAAIKRASGSSLSRQGAARILVNDRLDVALSQEAGGVHLGQNSLPVKKTRELAHSQMRSQDFLIGASCHTVEGATVAARDGANYIFFGPVFATPSKAAYGAPQGLLRLAEICRAVSLPVLAIGGVTLDNAASCITAGASGIAAIRLFQHAKDLASVVNKLRSQKF